MSEARAESAPTAWPVMRLLVSLGLIAVVVALGYIPVPGLDLMAVEEYGDGAVGLDPSLSLGVIGITPYLSAYMLIEIFHALWHWQRRRDLQPRDRRGLGHWVVGATALLAAWQAFFVARFFESVRLMAGPHLVSEPGWGFRLSVIASLTAATLLLVWLSRLVTRAGLGNGVALLLLVSLLSPLWRGNLEQLSGQWALAEIPPIELLPGVLGVAALFYAVVRIERWQVRIEVPRAKGAAALSWPLKGNPGGLIPKHLVAYLLFLPAVVAPAFGSTRFDADTWGPGRWAYEGLFVILLPAAVWLYLRLTVRPVRQAAMLTRAGLDAGPVQARLKVAHRTRWIGGWLYLVGLSAASVALVRSSVGWILGAVLSVIVVPWVVAILLDLKDEIAFRRRHPGAVLVGREHDMDAAKLVQSLLEQAHGIPCLVQAYQARALDTFLGPSLELELWVPAARVDEAREVLGAIEAPLT